MRTTRTAEPSRAQSKGFSLIETLVVLTIISILAMMLTTALTKAVRMAKSTASGEEMRQDRIGKVATSVHEGAGPEETPAQIVQHARAAFRQTGQAGMTKIVSSVLYAVRNDHEFRAYWHTLLNPENSQTAKFTASGALIAFTPEGERVELARLDGGPASSGAAIPSGWEFISTRLDETGRGDLGGNVIYCDGRREYVPYPAKFPMSRSVALLSHQFVSAFGE
jgi:prepilin-type N-terminal cleavage/methylation domain-containing protein